MLKDDIVPILVGGTHYYIQSVIWDVLIDQINLTTDLNKNKLSVEEGGKSHF
jgi:tRNA A37 N6-isopentenylltransferase MiaA